MSKDFNADEKNDLAFGYNENKIVIMPKNPETIFLYWDFSNETFMYITQNKFGIGIRLYSDDKKDFSYIYPSYTNRDWYYSIKYTDIFRDNLVVELGYHDRDGKFLVICSSKKVVLIDAEKVQNNSQSSINSQEFIKGCNRDI
jgi:hypothetical protein